VRRPVGLIPILLVFFTELCRLTHAQSTTNNAELKINGAVSSPLTLTVTDLKKMPRKTLSVLNPYNKKTEVYEGVPLEELFAEQGSRSTSSLRGRQWLRRLSPKPRMVIKWFSLWLNWTLLDSEAIVADTLDGAALAAKEGPFKIVAPHESVPHAR